MKKLTDLPLIGVPTSIIKIPGTNFMSHTCGQRYIASVNKFSKCIAVQIPSIGKKYDYTNFLERFDGILLTGGKANIEPHNYGGPPFPPDEPIDPDRDGTVLQIIPACVDAGIPLLGICRGLQEINVAMGGSLHYRINEILGKNDHRMPRGDHATEEDIFELRHSVNLTPENLFHKMVAKDKIFVNSLHGQGVDRLGEGLVVQAISEDNVIEGISIKDHPNFATAVQWHTEFHPERKEHTLSRKLYEAFGKAAKQRMQSR
jgi:putative glutamine amidotransferase